MAHCNHVNTLTQTNTATGTVTYFTWDYQNRLTEVKVKTSGGTVLNDEKFTYDVFGNRIGVSLNGTQTLYTVYDGSNPYMDFNGSGSVTERYLTNPDALSQFYGQVSAGGTVQWFLTDNINSIREVVDSSGNSLDVIAYDPWGTILSQSNAANAPRFLYTGGAYDPITGMYTDGARELNPADGRWMSQDPLAFEAGDSNLYRYVFNVPTNRIDPTGLAEDKLKRLLKSRGIIFTESMPLHPAYNLNKAYIGAQKTVSQNKNNKEMQSALKSLDEYLERGQRPGFEIWNNKTGTETGFLYPLFTVTFLVEKGDLWNHYLGVHGRYDFYLKGGGSFNLNAIEGIDKAANPEAYMRSVYSPALFAGFQHTVVHPLKFPVITKRGITFWQVPIKEIKGGGVYNMIPGANNGIEQQGGANFGLGW